MMDGRMNHLREIFAVIIIIFFSRSQSEATTKNENPKQVLEGSKLYDKSRS